MTGGAGYVPPHPTPPKQIDIVLGNTFAAFWGESRRILITKIRFLGGSINPLNPSRSAPATTAHGHLVPLSSLFDFFYNSANNYLTCFC